MKRGAFIVLEGVDRSGKTTLSNLLTERLAQSLPTERTFFPDRSTEIGSIINRFLRKEINLSDESIHLLYSANRWEKNKEILERLNSGVTIISDRYSYSGVAFSIAKGMSTGWCKAPEKGLPRPDLLLFLDLSPDAAAARPGFGDERYEVTAFQKQVKSSYEELRREDEAIHQFKWTMVDAGRTIEEVLEDLVRLSLSVIEDVKDKPIAPLWQENSNDYSSRTEI